MWMGDWSAARERLAAWWAGDGLALCLEAPADEPWADVPDPGPPQSLEQQWLDPAYRLARSEWQMSNTWYGGCAFPYFDIQIGPGSLGLLMGGTGHLAHDTVWYEPWSDDPEAWPALSIRRDGPWWRHHVDLINAGCRQAEGRYLIGIADLIENVDTLIQLRGAEALLMDLHERPTWVHAKLAETNEAFFEVFQELFDLVKDSWGGNAFAAFKLWGPGKTAKVQCDAAAMISPKTLKDFVVPYLAEQCAWLDYSMYHLDGTQALPHLDTLLAIPELDAIEWTPQAGLPGGGDPLWYDLYRRIRAGGKAVQAIGVRHEQVLPLIDAVGPEGLFIMTQTRTQAEAEELVRQCYG